MERSIEFRLNHVAPTPCSLRADPKTDSPASATSFNLGALCLHYWLDSFGASAPRPDPTRYEYLELISASGPDFRLHKWIADASIVKRRELSTGLGQAFCRLMLQEHFGVHFFAHMHEVLDKPSHAAFDGLRVRRTSQGDVPDYLCARSVTKPFIAEAKGRFSSVGFQTELFQRWRDQFRRIIVQDRTGQARTVKGYIAATRLACEDSRHATCLYLEDPVTIGEGPTSEGEDVALTRVAAAMHYATIFNKFGLSTLAAALLNGFTLTNELTFQVPVWTCMVPPFQGQRFIGGFFRTRDGLLPNLTKDGWQMPLELNQGHGAFIGLAVSTASALSSAARGFWSALDRLEELIPNGPQSSEFSWLPDGTVSAPMTNFLPTGAQIL